MAKRYLSVEAADSQAAAAAAVQQYEAAARLVHGRVDDAAVTICTGWEAVQEESVDGSPSRWLEQTMNEPLSASEARGAVKFALCVQAEADCLVWRDRDHVLAFARADTANAECWEKMNARQRAFVERHIDGWLHQVAR